MVVAKKGSVWWNATNQTSCVLRSREDSLGLFGIASCDIEGTRNYSRLDKLQYAWPEAALPRYVAGHGRSVLAAACLGVSRFLATAGLLDGTFR